MIRFFLTWFLLNYSYENLTSSYKVYKQENPIREMSEFIQHQQYREDQLRAKCKLHNVVIEPTPSLYKLFIESLTIPKLLISDKLYKRIIKIDYNKPLIYMETLQADTYEDFMNYSYDSSNEGKLIIYGNYEYTLIQSGIKGKNIFNYANQMNLPHPRKPTWSLKLDNHTITIVNVKKI